MHGMPVQIFINLDEISAGCWAQEANHTPVQHPHLATASCDCRCAAGWLEKGVELTDRIHAPIIYSNLTQGPRVLCYKYAKQNIHVAQTPDCGMFISFKKLYILQFFSADASLLFL